METLTLTLTPLTFCTLFTAPLLAVLLVGFIILLLYRLHEHHSEAKRLTQARNRYPSRRYRTARIIHSLIRATGSHPLDWPAAPQWPFRLTLERDPGWICPECTTYNHQHTALCRNCQANRPHTGGSEMNH